MQHRKHKNMRKLTQYGEGNTRSHTAKMVSDWWPFRVVSQWEAVVSPWTSSSPSKTPHEALTCVGKNLYSSNIHSNSAKAPCSHPSSDNRGTSGRCCLEPNSGGCSSNLCLWGTPSLSSCLVLRTSNVYNLAGNASISLLRIWATKQVCVCFFIYFRISFILFASGSGSIIRNSKEWGMKNELDKGLWALFGIAKYNILLLFLLT